MIEVKSLSFQVTRPLLATRCYLDKALKATEYLRTNMEIHQLRYFVAAADEGSFSQAAEREHCVPTFVESANRRRQVATSSPEAELPAAEIECLKDSICLTKRLHYEPQEKPASRHHSLACLKHFGRT